MTTTVGFVRGRSLTGALLVVGVVGALSLACCGKKEVQRVAGESLPGVSVELLPVESGEITIFEEVPGTVQPKLQASVAPKVMGRILKMKAVPGTRVEEGELLVELEVSDARAAMDRAKADLDRAKADLRRYEALTPGRSVSQAEVDRVKAGHAIAEATYNEAKRRVEYAEIKAPFSGVITRRYMDAGDLASPQRPVFKIEDPSRLRLELNVAESLVGVVEIGQKFQVRINSLGVETEGTVSEIEPSGDPGSRTFMVKLDLPDDERIRPGVFGRAFLPRGTREAILIPEGSVLERGQMRLVFVDSGGKALMRLVREGRRGDGVVEILSGLEEGDQVVLAPPRDLREGQPILRADAKSDENQDESSGI